MSEDTGAAATAPGTGEAEGVDPGTVTDQEDAEAAGLLGGMLSQDPDALAEELDKWRRESRKWEGRAKENSKAAAKLQEIEDANKTELEKALDAQRLAEEQRDAAVTTHSRVMAAAANNLPVELIDYLGSGTEDEINERAAGIAQVIERTAQELAQQIIAGQAGRNGLPMGARPVESMRPGSAPASGGTPQSPDEWFRQLLDNR
jgi:hypothetical protein